MKTIPVTRQYVCGWGLMVSFMGGGEWWADLWFIERRRMKYVHRKSTQFDPFLSHTYIASLPTKDWGRRKDLHSDDDREDGLVGGTFTRLLGINNSNNKCKLIILIPFLSSFSVPRLQTVFLATLSSFSVGNSMYKSKCIITIFNILGCGWFRSYKSNFGTLLIFTECSTYGK